MIQYLRQIPITTPASGPVRPRIVPVAWVLWNFAPSNADGPLTWAQEYERVYAGDAGHQKLIEALIEQHGVIPGFVVLDPTGWVRDGHHRLMAAVRLGIEQVPVHVISELVEWP